MAVCAAGAANLALMRNKELTEGVTVVDKEGHEYGKSKVVGKMALG